MGFHRAERSTVSPAVSDPERSSCPRGAPPAPGQQLSKQSRADGTVLLGLGAAGAGSGEGELSAPAGHGLMDGKGRLPTIQRGPPQPITAVPTPPRLWLCRIRRGLGVPPG